MTFIYLLKHTVLSFYKNLTLRYSILPTKRIPFFLLKTGFRLTRYNPFSFSCLVLYVPMLLRYVPNTFSLNLFIKIHTGSTDYTHINIYNNFLTTRNYSLHVTTFQNDLITKRELFSNTFQKEMENSLDWCFSSKTK